MKACEERVLFESEGWLRLLPLYVHEGRGLTPSGIVLAAKRMQNKLRHTPAPLGLVIVDHMQKIRPERDMRGNKVAEMTEVSDALQKMAGTLSVPVVALSQLNRAVEGRADRKPELSDLRESGVDRAGCGFGAAAVSRGLLRQEARAAFLGAGVGRLARGVDALPRGARRARRQATQRAGGACARALRRAEFGL